MESVEGASGAGTRGGAGMEWLQEAIDLVARAKADQEDADAFRLFAAPGTGGGTATGRTAAHVDESGASRARIEHAGDMIQAS